MYAPIFNKVADKYRDQVEVYDINVDNDPETAQKYEVRSIPFTVLVKEDGSIVRKVGILSENEIEELFLS
jgi:thioredoxin 1